MLQIRRTATSPQPALSGPELPERGHLDSDDLERLVEELLPTLLAPRRVKWQSCFLFGFGPAHVLYVGMARTGIHALIQVRELGVIGRIDGIQTQDAYSTSAGFCC